VEKAVTRLRSLCTLALLAALWLPSIGSTQSSEPESLVRAFATAWNAHDPSAFEQLFAPDADWVTAPGSRVKGRSAIRDFLAREHETWARTTTMTPSNILVRFPSPHVAVVLFEWEIAGALDAAGKVADPGRGNNLFVATRQADRWTIVSGQVASRRARAAQ
jgi:uncharacterized protein (TIGR02246 family)